MEKRFPQYPLTLACLPWKEDYNLDFDRFADEIEAIKAYGRFTIYYGCTAGEGYALSPDMFCQITRFFARQTRGYDLPVAVCIITTSLAETIERVDFVKRQGIHNIMFPLPSWGILRPEEAENYMSMLFKAHPDCNFIHYNHSYLARIRMYADNYERLCKKHKNFVAVKNACCEHLDIRLMAERDLPLLEYYLEFFYTLAHMRYNPSFLPSILCINRTLALEYYDAGQRKDFQTLLKIDAQSQRVREIMAETLPGNMNDGAYDKLFARINDPTFPIRMYPPYFGADEQQYESFYAQLKARVPEWLATTP